VPPIVAENNPLLATRFVDWVEVSAYLTARSEQALTAVRER